MQRSAQRRSSTGGPWNRRILAALAVVVVIGSMIAVTQVSDAATKRKRGTAAAGTAAAACNAAGAVNTKSDLATVNNGQVRNYKDDQDAANKEAGVLTRRPGAAQNIGGRGAQGSQAAQAPAKAASGQATQAAALAAAGQATQPANNQSQQQQQQLAQDRLRQQQDQQRQQQEQQRQQQDQQARLQERQRVIQQEQQKNQQQQQGQQQQQQQGNNQAAQPAATCPPAKGGAAAGGGNAAAGKNVKNGLEILGDSCAGSTLSAHTGFQEPNKCSSTQFGEVPSAEKAPTLLITQAPQQVQVGQAFTLDISTRNLVRDRFLGAALGGYYLESSFLNGQGLVRGHFHTACRMLANTNAAPDPAPAPAFFVATEDGKGGANPDTIKIQVTGMPSKGTAQCAAWAGDGSHRIPMMENAKQTPAFDAVRIQVN
jgi:hypothetical protein